MGAFADAVLTVIGHHPAWSGVIIFLIGFVETLLVVGYFVPGTALMVGAGVLVGQGAVKPEIAMAGLLLGGVAGDALGFWLGRHYGERILAIPLIARRRALVEKTQAVITRHAGKAILLARVVGAMRPLVPFLAGVAQMGTWRFLFFNVLSSGVSTVAHLLPGVAIGIGLHFTGAMTGRLAVLLVLLIVIAWLAQFVARWLLRLAARRGPVAIKRLQTWGSSNVESAHPARRVAAVVLVHLVDPQHSATTVLVALGAMAVGSIAGIVQLIGDVLERDPVDVANASVDAFLQGLRNPWGDSIMVVLGGLGTLPVTLALIAIVAAFLIWLRAPSVLLYWLLACAFAFGSAALIDLVGGALDSVRFAGSQPSYALPSAHAAVTATILGYIAFLGVHLSQRIGTKVAVVVAALVLISLISVAQLYFGTVFVSGLASGLLVGIVWLSMLGAVTLPRLRSRPRWAGTVLIGATALVVVLSASLDASVFHAAALAKHPREPAVIDVAKANWLRGAWQTLPDYRVDLIGEPEAPANVQIAGGKDAVSRTLDHAGWHAPPAWDAVSLARLVTAARVPPSVPRPVLPHVWNGRPEALIRIKETAAERLVLRLWDIGYRIPGNGATIYVGVVGAERAGKTYLFNLIAVPPKTVDYDEAARVLARDLRAPAPGKRSSTWHPPQIEGAPIPWDGATLIVDLDPS